MGWCQRQHCWEQCSDLKEAEGLASAAALALLRVSGDIVGWSVKGVRYREEVIVRAD